MLLVDRVLEWEPGKRATVVKNVTINEQFFQGHYPELPIMPGVLIVEAMAQAAGIALATREHIAALPALAGVDGARFRRPVVPGDQLLMEAVVTRGGRRMGKVETTASVEGNLVAEAQLLFTYLPRATRRAEDAKTSK
jgi:3-hydroxyacyl-[acyl-carrier-protein] dehydratase